MKHTNDVFTPEGFPIDKKICLALNRLIVFESSIGSEVVNGEIFGMARKIVLKPFTPEQYLTHE